MNPCSREPCTDPAVAVVRTENPRTQVTVDAALCARHRDALLARTRGARVVRSLRPVPTGEPGGQLPLPLFAGPSDSEGP